MYKISQFSKISGLTVKALRYYDEENILKPSFRSEENQYRYYNDKDLKKALLIKLLRTLDFSIMEIRDIIENNSEDDLKFILQEKVNYIEKNISKEKELIQRINNISLSLENNQAKTEYIIDTVDIDELFVASIQFKGKYSDLNKYIPLLYNAVKDNKSGNHFNCYYDNEYVENAEMELCIPIKKEIYDNAVLCKCLPKVTAIHTIHYGSYETLYIAYKTLFEYANSHKLNILLPIREVYVKKPGMIFRGNPENYVTEIFMPIEIDRKE